MRPRRYFGGDLSWAFGAALLSAFCFPAAQAGEKLAFVEIGFGDPQAQGAQRGCEDRASKKGRDRCATQPTAPGRLERPLFAVVSIADQSVSIYNHQGLVTRSAVSTGMAGHDTPKGIYTIIGRERMHASNIYSGAPMPFMQRLTWSGIAMHLGVVPGHPASHGCVRLPSDFAFKLWGMTRIGERVVIAPYDVTPAPFAHSLLPTPKLQILADAGAAASATASPPPEPPKLNPRQYAERLKAKATADRKAAAKADAEAFLAVDGKETEALRLADELKAAEAGQAAAQAKAEAAMKSFESAEAAARETAAAAKAKAEEEGAAAAAKLDAARKASEANARETSEAYQRWQVAAKAFEAAQAAEKEAEFRTAPVSVLISKADKRVYVRQGLAPVFDAPANVRDPKTPLGSHLYIATAADADDGSLKWSVVSIASRSGDEPSERKKAKAAGGSPYDFFPAYSALSSSAEEALERVEIPEDIRERISERLWTGASIIISDQPLSGETGNVGTDLVIRLR
jgi:hypothetical protein